MTTINPGILSDSSNVNSAPLPQTNPHVYNKPYFDVHDHVEDLSINYFIRHFL